MNTLYIGNYASYSDLEMYQDHPAEALNLLAFPQVVSWGKNGEEVVTDTKAAALLDWKASYNFTPQDGKWVESLLPRQQKVGPGKSFHKAKFFIGEELFGIVIVYKLF